MDKLKALYEAALKAPVEKHNKTYHQDEPVQFKKPKEVPNSDDKELPTAEKDQQDVLDRMETQSQIASPTSVEFFTKLRNDFQSAVNEVNGVVNEEESEAAKQAKEMGLIAKPYGNWADPKTGMVVAKTVKGQLVKIEDGDGANDAEPDSNGADTADSHGDNNSPDKTGHDKADVPSSNSSEDVPPPTDLENLIQQNGGLVEHIVSKLKDNTSKAKFIKAAFTAADDLANNISTDDVEALDIINYLIDPAYQEAEFGVSSNEGSNDSKMLHSDLVFAIARNAREGKPVKGDSNILNLLGAFKDSLSFDIERKKEQDAEEWEAMSPYDRKRILKQQKYDHDADQY